MLNKGVKFTLRNRLCNKKFISVLLLDSKLMRSFSLLQNDNPGYCRFSSYQNRPSSFTFIHCRDLNAKEEQHN